MRREQASERVDLFLCRGIQREAEEDDAGVGATAPEDELAESLVVGDQDAPLLVGNRENLLIGEAGRMVACDPRGVVAQVSKKRPDPCLGALVEEKPHAPAVTAPSRFGTKVLA